MDTGVIGSVTVMKSYVSDFGSLSAIIHGLVVSAILIPAAVSSFFAGRVADVLGRPKNIAIGALIFGLGTALEAGAIQLAMFVVGRIIEGIGEGLYLGTLVVYICEISPPGQRGPLTAGPQLFTCLGLMIGFFTCYGTANMSSSLAWRTPFILLTSFSIVFAVASMLWLVPSPRWLILLGRQSEASAAWDVLGVGHTEREKADMELRTTNVHSNILMDASSDQNDIAPLRAVDSTTGRGFLDVFARDVRSRTGLAVFLLGMQQLSGIDGVLYYAPILFAQAGLASSEASFLASGVSAIVIFSVTIPALLLSDKWGRRHSTIYGGLGLSATMFIMGGLYAGNTVHGDSGAARWVVIVCIYVFASIFCISWSIGIKIYVAESQPQRTRASATNLAHGSNWVTNFLVALTTPIMLANSTYGAYFLFGGCTLITAIVCFFFMPETKGKSLDEIEEAFRRRASISGSFSKTVRKILGTVSAPSTA
ncbi:MAG: hypothetical protein Q9191_004106 [Dirinaria sp. TL-2023a]